MLTGCDLCCQLRLSRMTIDCHRLKTMGEGPGCKIACYASIFWRVKTFWSSDQSRKRLRERRKGVLGSGNYAERGITGKGVRSQYGAKFTRSANSWTHGKRIHYRLVARYTWVYYRLGYRLGAISFPEAVILLVIDGDRDLWPDPTPEVRDSRTSRHSAHAQSQVEQIWLVLVSIYCVYRAIQNRNVVGPGQGSRFPAHDKRDPWGRGWARSK